jgi:hypothetical protein
MNETTDLSAELLAGTVPARPRRRDVFRGILLLDAVLAACGFGILALWVDREWTRAIDAAVVVFSVLEFGRVLLLPKD